MAPSKQLTVKGKSLIYHCFKTNVLFRAHSRPLIRLRLLNEHLEQQQEQQQQVLQDGGLNLSKQNSQNKGQQRKRKHVMVTLSDSPLLQEHKVRIFLTIQSMQM